MNKKNSFIVIQDWMLDDLGLSGAELMVYACIYGFSQDGFSYFQGSAGYLAKWAGVSKQQVFTVLKKLIEKNLIEKKEVFDNGVKFCNYRIITLGVVKKLDRGSQETLGGVVKKLDGGSQETLSHNIDIIYNHNIDNNIEIQNKEKPDKKQQKENPYKEIYDTYISIHEKLKGNKPEIVYSITSKRISTLLKQGITKEQLIHVIKQAQYDDFLVKTTDFQIQAILSDNQVAKLINTRPSYIKQEATPSKPKEYCSCGGELKYGVCALCKKENCTI